MYRWMLAGSSPRVRGTELVESCSPGPYRFIPACAGNGRPAPDERRTIAVHPRVCGERTMTAPSRRHQSGSSPRVRGTVFGVFRAQTFARFIPACAGNGKRRGPRPALPPVHPRVCGERGLALTVRGGYSGSSPRVRGTDQAYGWRRRCHRFIPACAGNGGLV